MSRSVKFTAVTPHTIENLERNVHIKMHNEEFTGYRMYGKGDYTVRQEVTPRGVKITITIDTSLL